MVARRFRGGPGKVLLAILWILADFGGTYSTQLNATESSSKGAPVAGRWNTLAAWAPEPNPSGMRQTYGQSLRADSGGASVFFRRWITCLMIGVLASVALPLTGSSAAAPNQRTRSYRLPSDGWKPGQAAMEAISSAPFHATLTRSGICTSDGSISYLWPAGYRVRFHPTVLLDPTGKVVAEQGQYITVGGGIVGTASWPSAARCYKGGDVFAIQSSVQRGRPGLIPAGTSSST
jgi:hypothetical protein